MNKVTGDGSERVHASFPESVYSKAAKKSAGIDHEMPNVRTLAKENPSFFSKKSETTRLGSFVNGLANGIAGAAKVCWGHVRNFPISQVFTTDYSEKDVEKDIDNAKRQCQKAKNDFKLAFNIKSKS